VKDPALRAALNHLHAAGARPAAARVDAAR